MSLLTDIPVMTTLRELRPIVAKAISRMPIPADSYTSVVYIITLDKRTKMKDVEILATEYFIL